MVVEHENIYTDLDLIPIYNFNKCQKGDLKYLFKDKKLIDDEITSKTWNKLYNDFCRLTYNNSVLRFYRLIGEIEFLHNLHVFAPVLINLLTKTPKDDREQIYEELRKWKIKLNRKQTLEEQVLKSIEYVNNSKNKLKRKELELENIKNKPEKVYSLQQQKAKLHKALGIEINLHTCSVTEWLAYWDEVKNLKVENGE